MLTHDHAMFAGVNASLYTQLAGIAPASPGYRTVRIAPQVPPGLDARGREPGHGARHGRLRVAGRRTRCRLDVRVPANVTATVHVPVGAGQAVIAPAGAQPVGDGVVRGRRRGVVVQHGQDVGRRAGDGRRHGAADALADARRARELRRVHARRRSRLRRVDDGDRDVDRRRCALAVADPAGSGRLANGAFVLARPLQVRAGTAASRRSARAGRAGPVSNETVAIGFTAARSSARDPLRTGRLQHRR